MAQRGPSYLFKYGRSNSSVIQSNFNLFIIPTSLCEFSSHYAFYFGKFSVLLSQGDNIVDWINTNIMFIRNKVTIFTSKIQ